MVFMLVNLKEILQSLVIREGKQSTEDLSNLRNQIDQIDEHQAVQIRFKQA